MLLRLLQHGIYSAQSIIPCAREEIFSLTQIVLDFPGVGELLLFRLQFLKFSGTERGRVELQEAGLDIILLFPRLCQSGIQVRHFSPQADEGRVGSPVFFKKPSVARINVKHRKPEMPVRKHHRLMLRMYVHQMRRKRLEHRDSNRGIIYERAGTPCRIHDPPDGQNPVRTVYVVFLKHIPQSGPVQVR